MKIDSTNRRYLDILRGASILRVMLAHLGLSWFFVPYSQYISVILPVFFFVSGAVSFNSVINSKDKPYYFINRYITLIIPFFIFSAPFFLLNINESILTGYDVVKWLLAWPSRGSYPFDMRQLWFINALILMFFISYPIFKLSRKSLSPLFIALLISLLYIPISEHFNLIESWYEIRLLQKLDMPMQMHQVCSLINYYFFGALFYQVTIFSKNKMFFISLICLLLGLYLHLQIETFSNMKVFFFERNSYFTSLSYLVIFILLIFRDQIITGLNKIEYCERLCLILSRNSYALFLIHTPIILIFERYLGFDDLGSEPLLAVVKMLGVITVSLLIAPYLTAINNKLTKVVLIKNRNTHKA